MSETATTGPGSAPQVREILVNDLLDVLAAGVRDFRAAPLYGLFFGGIYALGGWALILLLVYFDLPFLVYPLAVGFAFVAPFVATGFYAVSHCLEEGEALSWGLVFGAVRRAAGREIGWMALVTGFSLFIWIDIAVLMFFGFLGIRSLNATELLTEILTTPMGILFLVLGNGVGAVISLVVFSFSVTSFPMLFHRDVDFVTAMGTSVRVVVLNRRAMVAWCITIAVLIAACLLTGLLGLFVMLPILGHASWHLYRRAID